MSPESANIEEKELLAAETMMLESEALTREVRVDVYTRAAASEDSCGLLLVNDGQDLVKMNFDGILQQVMLEHRLKPLFVAAIHCGPDRINEYGMSASADYKGRGMKAALYERFVISELLPHLHELFPLVDFQHVGFAGFSLGGLSALDIVWNHPEIFSRVGVFSGSLWWRSVSQTDKEYDQSTHRLMHAQIRKSELRQGMKFFFECGELDENLDRNRNGVIDSIDDTIDLMRELVRKGYREGRDIMYLQMPDGRHDVPSWAKAIPTFLQWGWALSV